MKNIQSVSFLAIAVLLGMHYSLQSNTSIYSQELQEYKQSAQCKIIFDKDMPLSIRFLQQNIENYKALNYWQRLARFPLFGLDIIVVTQYSMPKLYAYVEKICKQENIDVPAIFITRKKNFFNALAIKLLTSSGGIVIGQGIIFETSEEELEAIIAHEIGHIKYNQGNKTLLASFTSALTVSFATNRYLNKKINDSFIKSVAYFYAGFLAAIFIPRLLINKKFEKEADTFACDKIKKSRGIVEFFTKIKLMEQAQDEEFNHTYNLIRDNIKDRSDYLELMTSYYLAKFGHLIGKGFKWIYHHTPLGAHPSNEERIAAAQRYLDQQEATTAA